MMEESRKTPRKVFPTHIYDYNYKVSEGYYKPQKNYMEDSMLQRSKRSPPKHGTYAERFAKEPWYGEKRGLPYKSNHSALDEPLVKLSDRPYRSSSLVREIKDHEEEDLPLNIRVNRRRKRFEEEDEKLGIRPRNLHKISLTNGKPLQPLDGRTISDKLRDLDVELIKLAPRREEYYDLPSNNTSKIEVSNYKSSSRPLPSSRMRTTSVNEDYDSFPSRNRVRLGSNDDISETIRYHHHSNYNDEEDAPRNYQNRSQKIRDSRRLKQSRDITDGLQNIVEKMRINKIDFEDGYTERRDKGLRASTLDPLWKDEQQKAHVSYSVKHRKY